MAEIDNIKYSASAAMVRRMGDELIKDPYTAFSELIKNSRDADATEVFVKFRKTSSEGGSIIIQDNGTGMNKEDIKLKWARAAGESKVLEPYTKIFNRRKLGAKGIGRFSLLKLGDKVKVITRPEQYENQIVFTIDFTKFTDETDFNDMYIELKAGSPRQGFLKGTILEITDLKKKWRKREIKKVKDQLSHLIDPENKDQNFIIKFDCREYPELSGATENPISGNESHRLEFSINDVGEYKYRIIISGDEKKVNEKRQPLKCGAINGIIRYYKEGVKSRDRKLTNNIDESHMGVKVYHDGCRVRPYGEVADDWLDIEKKRSKSGGKYYIHSNAIAGSIYISSEANPSLKVLTGREAGMIENEDFYEFQNSIKEQINILNQILEQETRSNSIKQKRQTVKRILDTVVDCLNKEESEIYGEYITKIDRSKKGELGKTYTVKSRKILDLKPPSKQEWICNDCDEKWRVFKGVEPSKCMDYAVNREGELRNIEGCGSTNIQRSTHQIKDSEVDLSSIIAGEYALIDGRQLKMRVDYDMGANDDEYLFYEREIVINGNHIAYTVAEQLDRQSGKKYEIGDDVFVPALTIHITKCACLSWAELHFHETQKWDEYKSRYDNLQRNIYESVKSDLGFK